MIAMEREQRAQTLMWYCDLAYRNPEEISSHLGIVGHEASSFRTYPYMAWIEAQHIQAYLVPVRVPSLWGAQRARMLVIRGTDDLKDWAVDFKFMPKRYGIWEGTVHRGFGTSAQWLWNHLHKYIVECPKTKPWLVTGHSLGGALATLIAPLLVKSGFMKVHLETFAAPRVGSGKFARDGEILLPGTIRHVNNNDLVPRLPPSLCASHFGREMYYDAHGDLMPRNTFRRFLDRVHGRIHAIDEDGTDGFKDHGPKRYLDVCRRNLKAQRTIVAAEFGRA